MDVTRSLHSEMKYPIQMVVEVIILGDLDHPPFPAGQEFLDACINIPFTLRRGVERIEQLADRADADCDLGLRRHCAAQRRTPAAAR
jgi:hypothetical protein